MAKRTEIHDDAEAHACIGDLTDLIDDLFYGRTTPENAAKRLGRIRAALMKAIWNAEVNYK